MRSMSESPGGPILDERMLDDVLLGSISYLHAAPPGRFSNVSQCYIQEEIFSGK